MTMRDIPAHSRGRRVACLVILILFAAVSLPAQLPRESEEQKWERMRWWREARFGMFIHWGLYAQGARHEWLKRYERKTDEDYQRYFEVFDPDLYDPVEWARMAREAGMRYVVITSKHHEGFCLWDSEFTDYKPSEFFVSLFSKFF